MKTFTIENQTNNITVHGSAIEAEAIPDTERFGNEAALLKLAANWPTARLIDIWNNLPGITPVNKFKDRATAVSRIWKAIQTLGQVEPGTGVEEPKTAPVPDRIEVAGADGYSEALVPESPQTVTDQAPEAAETAQQEVFIPESPAPETATPLAPHAPDVAPEPVPPKDKATRAKNAPKGAAEPGTPREGSKTSQVIAMLKRDRGATLQEIMAETGWLKHTTRAMLSAGGSLTKKHGLAIVSEKVDGRRVYSIKA